MALIPQLISKIVVPKISSLLAHAWNPRSTKETKKALLLVKELFDNIDPNSDLAKVGLSTFFQFYFLKFLLLTLFHFFKELFNPILVNITHVIEQLPKKIQEVDENKQIKNMLKVFLLKNIFIF